MRVASVTAAFAAAGVLWACGPQAEVDAQVFETSAGPVRVEQVVGDLDAPWGVAFLPEGGKLITEIDGRLLHIGADGAHRAVEGLPEVRQTGQGGLMDVVAARDFAETRTVFLTYTAPDGEAERTTLASARLSEDGGRLEAVKVLFEQEPAVDSRRHFGSRVVEARDGTLFLTIGDRAQRPMAQDLSSTVGVVVRVNRDGSIPEDNPFANGGGHPAIWSYGHRNPQGAALGPDGRLWTVSHGARGGDEINLPEAGKNYGWPEVSYGTHYSGRNFPANSRPDTVQPLFYWVPSIAPSGMAIYSGRLWPEWEGDIFVGALKFALISRIARDGTDLGPEERLFEGEFGRIRDVREGPDGALWFLTDESPGGLYRVVPAE